MRNPCSVCCTAGILSSSKSQLGDDFRASLRNCYCGDWVLHLVLPLTSCDFCSQILSVYEHSIEVFPFFWGGGFTSESGSLLTYMKNIHFSSSLERPMETSWRNTASCHRDNVHVYDK